MFAVNCFLVFSQKLVIFKWWFRPFLGSSPVELVLERKMTY